MRPAANSAAWDRPVKRMRFNFPMRTCRYCRQLIFLHHGANSMGVLFCLTAALLFLPNLTATEVTDVLKASSSHGKYTYVMFSRQDDSPTRKMSSTIERQVLRKSEETSWVQVNVTDRSAAEIVRKYDASRLPMPTVMGVAPNGAITGVYQLKVTPQQLDSAILTPGYSRMVKKLQEQKIAVVCLQPARGGFVPAGVTQLEANSHLKNQVVRVSASANDASEIRFFERMRVPADIQEPAVLLFAPPGIFLGRFDADVSGQQLADAIHKSGKCSCRHCQNKAGR